MIKFLPLGGAGEIGSSCFYLNINGTGIILDCGMHPRKIGIDALPKLDLIKDKDVDFVFLSHAHHDHIGALPFLVKQHPYIKIFSTPQTRAISEITLHNTVSILEEQSLKDPKLSPYTHDEIDLLIKSINYVEHSNQFTVAGFKGHNKEQIKITFIDAGHILGSSGILIESENERIFYTGDINLSDQAIIKGASLNNQKVDTLILETTYGSTDSSQIPIWWNEAKRFSSSANQILQNGGSILIPVFSLGKMQEILATIWNLMSKGLLIKTDIYSGGIGKKINRIYDYNRYVTRRIDQEFELSEIPQKEIYEADFNMFRKNPSIVLAPSGMVIEGTLSFQLAQDWLKQDKFAIFVVGYMDPDTPGYKIANAQKGDKIQLKDFSTTIKVKCLIDKFRFSAHAKREELLEIVKQTNPSRVILIHGDNEGINWMGYNILLKYPHIKVHYAEVGKTIDF
ncbi:MAG: MBL fold metallo-hydrolase [Ignavibacteriales bacterium]|nr:MBL fold metallo-hydrolase [Ignavibacteriales bacterium]